MVQCSEKICTRNKKIRRSFVYFHEICLILEILISFIDNDSILCYYITIISMRCLGISDFEFF